MALTQCAESAGNFKSHLVSGCPKLAQTECIQRHDKAAAYLHWTVCKHYNIEINTMNMNQLLWQKTKQLLYQIGHANPNWLRDESKQTRHSGERQERKNLSAYPHRKVYLLENNGKTHKVQRSWEWNRENVGNENNNCPSCQEGNRKLHWQDPRQHQSNRATEDHPPWNRLHT